MTNKSVFRGLGELALLAGVLWGLHWWTTPRSPRLPTLPPPTWRGGPSAAEGELVDVSELLRRWGLE